MHSLYSYIFLVLIEDKAFLATRVKHRVTWKSYLFCTSQNKGREQQNIFLVFFFLQHLLSNVRYKKQPLIFLEQVLINLLRNCLQLL